MDSVSGRTHKIISRKCGRSFLEMCSRICTVRKSAHFLKICTFFSKSAHFLHIFKRFLNKWIFLVRKLQNCAWGPLQNSPACAGNLTYRFLCLSAHGELRRRKNRKIRKSAHFWKSAHFSEICTFFKKSAHF